MRPAKAFLRPARAFSIVEIVGKARPRISNCRSRISSILQRNFYIEMKKTLAARGTFMLIIWPFELSEFCRTALEEVQSEYKTDSECHVKTCGNSNPHNKFPCRKACSFYIVAIGNPERHVHRASHCGSKQQQRSCSQSLLLLLARSTYIIFLFFTHTPFVVNRTINATPRERLQQYESLGLIQRVSQPGEHIPLGVHLPI